MTTDFRATDGLAHRVRSDRWIAGLAAAGLLGAALGPALTVTPAAASPCTTQDYTARAAADLVTARVLDLRPLGADVPPLADLRVASTRSTVDSAATRKAHASADYLDADLLGQRLPAGPLDAAASQYAPPGHNDPASVSPEQLDAKLLQAGTGGLTAHATWKPGYGCRTANGLIADSYASDLDAAVLPAMPAEAATSPLGDGLATLPHNAFSRTATGLTRHHDNPATGAVAWIGLTELTLFGGTDHATTVRVVNPPRLAGLATGSRKTSSVTYSAPILEVDAPDGSTHRLDSPDQVFELTLPPSGPPVAKSESSKVPDAHAPGVPDLGDTPDVPGAPPSAGSPDQPNDPVGGLLKGLTGESKGGSGGGTGKPLAEKEESGPSLTLRLAIGHLESKVTRTSVWGEAASLRLQLLATPPPDATTVSGHSTQSGDAATLAGDPATRPGDPATLAGDPATLADNVATLADVGLGVLEVKATAPAQAIQPPSTTPLPASGGGGGLPVTGFNLLAVLATGGLLLVIGRFLMVIGRRRSAEASDN